jgi:hypothetical protein
MAGGPVPYLDEDQGGLATLARGVAGLPAKFQRELPMFLAGLRSLYEDPSRAAQLPTVQSAVQAAQLPRDVIEGRVDPRSEEGIGRAFDMAGWATGGSSFGSAPEGALAAGAPRRVRSPTGQMVDVPGEPQTYWSDLAKTKHTIPVEEMQATQVPTGELAPRRIVEPANLQGRVLIGEMGDRTQAGHRLTSIGGRPLAFDVDLQGGPNYMRAGASQGPDRAIWASDKGQVSRIAKFAESEGKRLKGEPTLAYTAMGARGGDFSHMMSDAVLAQVAQGGIAKKDLAAFDKAMKEKQPDWQGLRDIYSKPEQLDKVRKQLLAPGAGDLRKTFAEESSLGTWTEKGFPDPGQTRFAITDPELLGTPTGASGYAFSTIDPGAKPILNPSRPHTTYPTQLGGSYVGGFERTVPLDVMYPTFVKEKLAKGMRPEKLNRAFQIGNVSQLADQQWVDLMSQYLEQQRGRGP